MDELINEISNLFKKYGIKSVTMDDIANKFGISKKTLYQHFKNRDEIVYRVAQYELKNECEELQKLIDLYSNAIDQLLNISKYLFGKLQNLNPSLTYDMNKYYPEIWGKLVSQRKGYIHKLIKRNFQIGIEQGIYKENFDIDIIAVFYTSILDIKGFEMYNDVLNGDFDKMFNALFMYHINGIANNKGIEYLERQFYKLKNQA
jgi:TetR/AcrR family transcriptional regulator, cholesterol catabolism regulator